MASDAAAAAEGYQRQRRRTGCSLSPSEAIVVHSQCTHNALDGEDQQTPSGQQYAVAHLITNDGDQSTDYTSHPFCR
jgi:hypothetical protein